MFPPSIQLTPAQFEEQVAAMFAAYHPVVETLDTKRLAKVKGKDGTYEIDVLVTFKWMGLTYKTLVECKHHKNPIKRDDVQVLQSRLLSTGSQKGVVFSISSFQKGAIEYAQAHGIALVQIVSGDLVYQTRSAAGGGNQLQPLTVGWYLTYERAENTGMRLIIPNEAWFNVEGLV